MDKIPMPQSPFTYDVETMIELKQFDLNTREGCFEARKFLKNRIATVQGDIDTRKDMLRRIEELSMRTNRLIARSFLPEIEKREQEQQDGKEDSHE